MTALAWLIPAALVLAGLGLVAFLWALRSGQFDDLDGAAYRALEDDPPEDDDAEADLGSSGAGMGSTPSSAMGSSPKRSPTSPGSNISPAAKATNS